MDQTKLIKKKKLHTKPQGTKDKPKNAPNKTH
jgi:hypothetical protein